MACRRTNRNGLGRLCIAKLEQACEQGANSHEIDQARLGTVFEDHVLDL